MFNIPTWKIVFMKSTKDGYVEIARKRFNPKKQSVDFRGGTYITPIAEVTHHKGSQHFLYKDFDTGQSLAFDKGFLLLEPQDLKTLIATQLAKAAVNAGSSDYGLLAVVMCAIAGLAGGAILMAILYPMAFPNMVKEVPKAVQAVMML